MLYDLLSPIPGTPENLQIVDEAGVTVVKGLTQVQVSTEEEALALLFEGNSPIHRALSIPKQTALPFCALLVT